jgi:ABC-type nitrate/sulfonate/bicarbonate transport system substrate-binding protein
MRRSSSTDLAPADLARLTRRTLLVRSALSLVATATLPMWSAAAAGRAVHVSQPGRGSAGSVWRPLLERAAPALKEGLDIQFLGGDPGQEAVQLLAGALDVSIFGPIGAAESQARGKDIVIFAPGLNNHGSWIVRGDSSFRSPKDLRGKRIASQPETTETYRQARLAAALHGIDLKHDVEVIFGPPTANLALFERGDVEAVISLEPTSTRLIAKGAREIARVADMWREASGDQRTMFLGGQSTRRAWATENPALVKQLAKLYVSVNEEIHARPQILAELHDEMGIPATEREAIALLPKRLAETYAYQWDDGVFAVIDDELDRAVKAGILAKLPAKPVYLPG